MNPQVKAQWLEALRGGDYKQGQRTLRTSDGRFCCLGVLCDLHAKAHSEEWVDGGDWWRYLHSGADLPPEVVEWAGLPSTNPRVLNQHGILWALSDLNDGADAANQGGMTFSQIADLIEAQDGGVV